MTPKNSASNPITSVKHLPQNQGLSYSIASYEIENHYRDHVGVLVTKKDSDAKYLIVKATQDGGAILMTVKTDLRINQVKVDTQVLFVSPAVFDSLSEESANRQSLRESYTDNEQVKLVDELFNSVIHAGSADLHIVCRDNRLQVWYRINGVIVEQPFTVSDPDRFLRALWYRTKAESRNDEGGITTGKQASIDFVDLSGDKWLIRMQRTPMAPFGSSQATLRFQNMDQSRALKGFAALGYDDAAVQAMEQLSLFPHGMILVTGPTNSGKSTSLQTMLSYMVEYFNGEKVILTAEDPVEFVLPGVRQRDVSGKSVSYKDAITEMLRQDPDVIMIGEVRENSSASQLVRASETGHLTLSTLHAKDPVSVFKLLAQYGIDESRLADSGLIRGIVSQRLLPVLCNECSVGFSVAMKEFNAAQTRRYRERYTKVLSDLRFRGPGCDCCKGSGYKASTAVCSIVIPDHELLRYVEARRWDLASLYQRSRYTSNHSVDGRTPQEMADIKVIAGDIDPRDVETIVGPFDDTPSPDHAARLLEKFQRGNPIAEFPASSSSLIKGVS